ncbi:hypothetical protein HW452_09390 [Halomonas aquamarina]|uniref:Uncharacterized protein n=1 Tax=Vreelandella aquamarina TaxID=77097 RepID=A0ACC5VUZ8_9GAMM|nr:hypothetical protein [Halomonas aquamarina]MBZ5487739.1 hypothetical protein [Halomonas aquamarina]
MNKAAFSAYMSGAYTSEIIPPLPEAPKKRGRVGEELLPFGDYAHIDPYQQVCADAELVQHMEEKDKQFYESDDWWWDHLRIRFIKSQVGLSVLLMAFPFFYLCFLLSFPFYLSYITVVYMQGYDYNAVLAIFIALIIAGGGILGAAVIGAYTCQSVMNSIIRGGAYLTKPFKGWLAKQGNSYLENRQSELNRQTGMVSFSQGRRKAPLVAPFIEFDAYVERVVQRGGIFYRLMFVHRYTGKQFNQTSLSAIVEHQHEVRATWDMLQRYMDVSQPLPDVPRLEPFRHLDPTTAEHDRQTGRDPRYWRDLDLEAWKENEGEKQRQAQVDFPWSRQRCKLTPQLGKIDMVAYQAKNAASLA